VIADNFWPPPDAFQSVPVANQITDGAASCLALAVCGDDGLPVRQFSQGQRVHLFFEFAIHAPIRVPASGVEFSDARGWIIHGKNGFQYSRPLPSRVSPGSRLHCHTMIALEIAGGEYSFTIGLASVAESAWHDYQQGRLPHVDFARLMHEHCRVPNAGSLTVQFAPDGKLLHYGAVNLPGFSSLTVHASASPTLPPPAPPPAPDANRENLPTIFHVTHWKAGSQWLYKILADAIPDSIVKPEAGNAQVLHWPVRPGKVYPAVYVTKQDFDVVRKPTGARHFVVIRDLRDTLISAYFSSKISHPIADAASARLRRVLQSASFDDGMIYMMDEWLPGCARIQLSWLESGEPLIRYRDLLERDVDILERVLVDECRLPVDRHRFRNAVLANRFEELARRPRGQEDITAHERKGVAGDWKNHFNDRLKRAFKARYGGLLIATGFEPDLNW